MKITLYQYSEKDKTIGEKPNKAVIEYRKLSWEFNLNTHLPYSTWLDFEPTIDNQYKRLFRDKEFNVKMTVRYPTGFGLTYYANLNWVKMWCFKRILGIHWSQQPENIRFFWGYVLGAATALMIWIVEYMIHPPC
jgi:hypothetical protein